VVETLVAGEEFPANSLISPTGYTSVPDEAEAPLKAVEIYKGLFLVERVAGDRNVLFTMTNDGIVVFGAPVSDSWSKKVIEVIGSKFPGKKISYVYVTHFHSDHIGGLGAYLENGATVLVNEFSVGAIKERAQFKDLPTEKLKFKTIDSGVNFDGIEFHIAANSHAKGQSFVYFNKAKMIYEGDFLEIPFDNTIPNYMPQATRQFLDYLSGKQLKFERIIGHHRNSNISRPVVEEYVRRSDGVEVVY
jgi:glyoxylase-like metal-dependent hydrolase (beta-lactamase superfamily II)